MPENTLAVGYRTYTSGRLDRTALGISLIEVVCSDGESCLITVETATDKVLDVKGDPSPFIYWEENVKRGGKT